MTGHQKSCRRGCCWTPHDVCAKRGNCDCHRGGRGQETFRAAEAAGVGIDELLRRQRLADTKPSASRVRVKNEAGKWVAPKKSD